MRRVDETASRRGLERGFKHIKFSSINDEWNVHAHLKFLDDLPHQLHFVWAFGDGAGDIEGVRAKVYLFAGDLQNAIVIFFEQESLEFARALCVEALSEESWRRILSHQSRGHSGSKLRVRMNR